VAAAWLNEKYFKLVSTCLGDFWALAEDQVGGIAAVAAV